MINNVENTSQAEEADASQSDLIVRVCSPQIDGDRVTFAWEQSEPNPYQRQNQFFFRYEGIDVARCSSDLLSEVFLAMQLKVFAQYQRRVVVQFPEPVAETSAAFWATYHGASNVEILTLKPGNPSIEVGSDNASALEQRHYAVFFGGGKDSTLASYLLADLYGSLNVALLQFVGPVNDRPSHLERMIGRHENLMLKPARERRGLVTHQSWTDHQANFVKGAESARPHIELYTAGALPALIAHGIKCATFSYAWTDYPRLHDADGKVEWRWGISRPDVLKLQSRHYRRALGLDLNITNLGLLFSANAAYLMLFGQYPQGLEMMVPCTDADPTERWCFRCRKCALYAWETIRFDRVDPKFDYEQFFTKSEPIRKILRLADSGYTAPAGAETTWHPDFSPAFSYPSWADMISDIPAEKLERVLGPEAFANALLAVTMFGQPFPEVSQISPSMVASLDNDEARAIYRIATRHLEIGEDAAKVRKVGDLVLDYDFRDAMPTPLADLPYLR